LKLLILLLAGNGENDVWDCFKNGLLGFDRFGLNNGLAACWVGKF
jgi:hypothetical protein